MRIVFMGTPDYAVGALEAIVEAGYQVAAVVTQPDKPKGRGKDKHAPEVQMPPVKQCALKYGIPVFQPVKVKAPEAVEELRRYEADIFVVAAFGQILSEEILNMPRLGSINIHASLLPKYRGAAPIQGAILNGESETGITIMQMDKGIDTGDMLMKCTVPISEKDTGESLHDKLCEAGAKLITEALPLIENGKLIPEKQNEEEATYVTVLKKSQGHIDWTKEASVIDRLIRGLNPWPSAYTYYDNKTLKIWEAEPKEQEEKAVQAGTVTKVEKDAFYVKAGNGELKVTQVQLEGKKRMSVKDFLLGYALKPGTILGR
ncbi:methionyl-tRNA formyltransferase [Kineothrix alysoides]|uniref:Methionyl-tRNA formyltransferase n=1 Tax=Kineothrix alysoides TaxID=1469948 RepID=A0A4R1R3R2_9FIRM|nr:methionyl-tRNA formyltransferase [Kineothrix alysoides]TCL60091.1 methionyl-tRNA formyltransferase [Kineothrix alysoides]